MNFLTQKNLAQIQNFSEKLLEKNQQINLISRKNPKEQIAKLLKESMASALLLKPFFQKKNQKILDIGSGNGFPGLFFAILFPQHTFYLCERRRKKAEAIKWLSSQCQLPNTQVLCETAEKLNPDYDSLLSQACLPIDKMNQLLKKLLKPKAQAFLWLSKKQAQSFKSSFSIEIFPQQHNQKIILKLSHPSYKA